MCATEKVERWDDTPLSPWMPEEFFPQSIFPEARSVVVIGLPVTLPVLDTAPSIWYRTLYNTINTLLDQYTYRLSVFLNEAGYPSVFVPRDGYGGTEALMRNPVTFFSHRHAAFLAGLGTFGVNNILLTPGYGPRVRFGSVITAAPLPPDPLMDRDLCTRCMVCVRCFPVGALDGEDYPAGLTDRSACLAHHEILEERFLFPCGICIKVCPVGEDRQHYQRKGVAVYERDQAPPEWEHVRRYGSL